MSKTIVTETLPWNNNPYFGEKNHFGDINFKTDLPARFYLYNPSNLCAVSFNEEIITINFHSHSVDKDIKAREIVKLLEKDGYTSGTYIVDWAKASILYDFVNKKLIKWTDFRMIPPKEDSLNASYNYFVVFKNSTGVVRKTANIPKLLPIINIANSELIKPNGRMEDLGCEVVSELISQQYDLNYDDREYISVYCDVRNEPKIENELLKNFEEEYYKAINFLVGKKDEESKKEKIKLTKVGEIDFENLNEDDVFPVEIDTHMFGIKSISNLYIEIRKKCLYVYCAPKVEQHILRVANHYNIPTKYCRFIGVSQFNQEDDLKVFGLEEGEK